MNDKQQLAAMGAQYRLTEEQAKALAERMPKAGVLQILDDEPLCMAKRIEELEAQVRVMGGLLMEAQKSVKECANRRLFADERAELIFLVRKINDALSCSLPAPSAPEGWKLVPVEPTEEILRAIRSCMFVEGCYRAMLAAAPSPDSAK